jgi:hypothetical protein
MIRLFTTHYPEPDPARRAEYAECLSRNLGCEAIAEVRILVEGGAGTDLPENPKLFTRPISARPTYADFFAWINELAEADDVSIIANSDIYFDGGLQLAEAVLSEDHCLALSRWDVLGNGRVRLFEHGDSQDCWIFRGPVRPVSGDFPLGVYDCDNKIAWELEAAGYRVINPSLGLRSYHLHRSAVRGYDPQCPPDHGIRPPFLYVEPENLGSLLTCARLWRRHQPGYFPWRFTWKKFLRTRPGRPFRYLVDGVTRRFGC